MGRPGCEQCCGKPEPAQCLSCLHACEYAEVNDPDLLEKYWNEKVYQPTGYVDLDGDFGFGYNASRTYLAFDPEVHPCNEDKFEYVVFVLNCQLNPEIPNGDYDICINGENLGTYYGSDMINPQDIPTFEGLPLFPFDSKHNESQACGPALYKHTIFGTSQEAIDQAIDTNFGHGWLTSGGIGQPNVLIPPSERRTIADFNTYVVPKDSFLMDARDIVIDQSGNPSFGPRSGSFNIKFIPNPGINNLRLDLRVDGNGTEATMRAWKYSSACAVPQGIIDRDDARGGEDGVHNYPVQWTPPSKVQVIIYSLERPIGYNQGEEPESPGEQNDDPVTAGFRFCSVANGCFCAPTEEEVCDNFGFRPLCVNPFDSDNYEDGEAKFISAADYDASTECTCDDDEEYKEPESPGDEDAAPTCYYEVDIFSDAVVNPSCFVLTSAPTFKSGSQNLVFGCQFTVGFPTFISSEGDWKGTTLAVLQELVDNAQDGPRFKTGAEPINPGYGARIMRAVKAKAEEVLARLDGCPNSIDFGGYVGPFAFSENLLFSGNAPVGAIYGSQDGMFGNLNDVYLPFSASFSYQGKALSDAIASDIKDPDRDLLKFDGTCCATWGDESDFFRVAPATLRNAGGVVRDKTAGFITVAEQSNSFSRGGGNVSSKWSTNLGRLLLLSPGGRATEGWNLYPCEEATTESVGGDNLPLYLDIGDALAATAPWDLGFASDSPLGFNEVTKEDGYFSGGLRSGEGPSRPIERTEFIVANPFLGELDGENIVYTLNNLSTGQYYFNVDAQCAGIGCTKPEQPEGEDPCLPCGQCIPLAHEIPNFLCISSVTECPPDPRDPCQPFAADPANCADITNGIKEYQLDDDGNVYCGILCNAGYVLEYDDVTGCAQCVQVQCQGSCNFSWTGNSWNFFPIGSTCPCKCEPPNIPGTFVGEIGQGTCVDDIANRICGEGKCWWTWFNLVGGGGEWRKNGTDDPFGISTDCECRCDPPNRDGFAGEQLPTGCYE